VIVQIASFSFSFIGLLIVLRTIISIRPRNREGVRRSELSSKTAMDYLKSTK